MYSRWLPNSNKSTLQVVTFTGPRMWARGPCPHQHSDKDALLVGHLVFKLDVDFKGERLAVMVKTKLAVQTQCDSTFYLF